MQFIQTDGLAAGAELESASRAEDAERLEALLAEIDERAEPVRKAIKDRLTPQLMRARYVLSGYLRAKQLPDTVGWIPREITEARARAGETYYRSPN